MKGIRKNMWRSSNINIRRWIAAVCIFVMVMQLGGRVVYAESITGEKGDMTISADSDYLYFSYEGAWANYLSERIQVSTDGTDELGSFGAIVLNTGNEKEEGSIIVLDAWNNAISGASGTVTNTGKKEYYGYENMKWSIQVPISVYDKFSFKNMTFSWGGKSVTLAVREEVTEDTTEETEDKTTEISTEETSSETSTEVPSEGTGGGTATEASTEQGSSENATEATTEVNSSETNTEESSEEDDKEDIIVSGSVQIDGMYDDWNDIPKTYITYDGTNGHNIHYGQMITDGVNIYAHFQTNQLETSQLNIHLWYLTINDQTFHLRIWPERDGKIDWESPVPYKEGTYTNLKVFIGYDENNECGSQVVYTIYDTGHAQDTPGDDIEFSFSLERLSEITGIPVDQMGTISLSNPNLGNECVTIAGSSTGPVAGVAAAFVLAVEFFRKKKETKNI